MKRVFVLIGMIVCIVLLISPVVATPEGTPLEPGVTNEYYSYSTYSTYGSIDISGSGVYYLTQDLTPFSPDHAITISASNVILDGNDKNLDTDMCGYGISLCSSLENVTIRNFGRIQDFTVAGIYFSDGNKITISGNTFYKNENGILTNNAITNLNVSNNTFYTNNYGIYFMGSTDGGGTGVIYNNYISNNNNISLNGPNVPSGFVFNRPGGPVTGINIIGGPYIAGNYWSNPSGTGFSDTHTADENGYTSDSYTEDGAIDNFPLVRFPPLSISAVTPKTGVNTKSIDITDLAGGHFLSGAIVNLTRSGETNITATNVVIVSRTNLTCTFPITGKQVGTWDLYVTNPDGECAKLVDGFTITHPRPVISGITPNNQLVNTHTVSYQVTVTGTNFISGCTATLNNNSRAVTVTNSTFLTVTFLATDDDITGTYPLVITNPDPSAGASSPMNYLVVYPAPTITCISPVFGVNTGFVEFTNLSGANFLPGASVNLSKTDQTSITATGVSVVSSTRLSGTLPITGAAAGTWKIWVTNTDGQAALLSNKFTIYNAPSVILISPSSGEQGRTYSVTIAGPNFEADKSIVSVSGTGVTVGTYTTRTANQITFPLIIAATAESGVRTVTVTNPTSGATATGTFTVGTGPAISGISPNSGVQGRNYTVTITGANFETEKSIVTVSGTGIIVGTYTTRSSIKITFPLTIAATAESGVRIVTVTNPTSGATTAGTFTVDMDPVISGISPSSGEQGGTYTVTITGANFETEKSIVTVSGTGVTLGTYTIRTATKIICPVTLTSTATKGARTVTVTNPTSGAKTTGTFTVRTGPKISKLSPASGQQGGKYVVTITGTNFEANKSTVSVSGIGVTIGKYTSRTAKKIVVPFTISTKAVKGVRTITVKNPTTGGTATGKFTVAAGPVISKISPASGLKGKKYIVTITGTNFEAKKSTVTVSGTGVTVGTYTTRTAKKIVVPFTIAAKAAKGVRTITVKNPVNGGTATGKFTVAGTTSPTEADTGLVNGIVLSTQGSTSSVRVPNQMNTLTGGVLVPVTVPVGNSQGKT